MRLQSDVGRVWTLLRAQLEMQDIFFNPKCIVCLRWDNLGPPRHLSLHATSLHG